MPICTFLVIGTFNDSEIRRRLYSSPTRLVSLQMQEMLTCATFGWWCAWVTRRRHWS